jgi:hypothetical protein
VPLEALAKASIAVPSITTWTRLEPLPCDASMERSLQAQVRDPAWMLGRQWQVGEFLGADAGSPVQATLAGQLQTITTYCPGGDSAATIPLDQKLPLEVHVERENVELKLRGSVQLGFYFESLVVQNLVANADTVIAAFRQSFPIAATPPDPTYAPVDAVRFRSLMAGRATNGEALYASAAAIAAGQTPVTPLPAAANNAGMPVVISAFLEYRASLFNEPLPGDSAWQSEEVDYDFSVGSPTAAQNLALNSAAFPGGRLDWYSFAMANASANAVAAANPAQVTPFTFNFFPNRVTFRGVHDPRWWTFEDSVTDFGQLDAQQVDLAKLLVMEFALVYGSDWFSVPIPSPIGNLCSINTLVVSDTFGVRTLIRPAEDTTVNTDESPWSMFKLSGDGVRSNFIMLAPTLGLVQDASDLEEVMFLRDNMAAMAWAVEHQLPGDLDSAVNAQEAYLQRLAINPAALPPHATTGGPQISYTLEQPVPDNWIPLVPVQTPSGALYLRRGTMEIPTQQGLLYVVPRALILQPGKPFFLADRALPPTGILVDRYFRRTRSVDGSTYVWLARKSGPGRGPGWSGLRFDLAQDMAKAASS